ncbi:hypothetical protein BDY19DRAFT_958230 [Irpex rosettiformis]|uniref:Uncharacterized protein n=1 Tax=Irpex rosettiformis TaxID=378272 RepID=A0ACB8TYT8_9APHY|nr:hypothetical protein BDY19DRAFT_958230 [Irpex rosettiformis]
MPIELPGFYWDEVRQRYFPITSRSAQPFGWQPSPSVATVSTRTAGPIVTSSQPEPERGGHEVTARPKKKRRFTNTSPPTFATRERIKHDITSDTISCLSKGSVVYCGDFPCSSFNASDVLEDGVVTLHTGDTGGWLQTCSIDPHGFAYNSSRELYLGSEVTTLCHSANLRVAVSFGPSSKIALENTLEDSDMWTIVGIPDKRAHDFRVADLQGSRLAIGAASRGIVLPNIEYSWHWDALNTGSDVLAICQKDFLVYTGTRNGSIKAFDIRVNTQRKGQSLFGERFSADTRSITHLSIINEWQMVVSTIRGDLEVLDLRFARADAPVMSLHGHVNSYSTKLGITTSLCSSFLFAAGQDTRIRAWSIHPSSHTTQPIDVLTSSDLRPGSLQPQADRNVHSQEDPDSLAVHPLCHTFKDPIVGLQVTGPTSSSSMMTLWAGEGKNVWRFGLGCEFDHGGFHSLRP